MYRFWPRKLLMGMGSGEDILRKLCRDCRMAQTMTTGSQLAVLIVSRCLPVSDSKDFWATTVFEAAVWLDV